MTADVKKSFDNHPACKELLVEYYSKFFGRKYRNLIFRNIEIYHIIYFGNKYENQFKTSYYAVWAE